jgi:hypothetical protein
MTKGLFAIAFSVLTFACGSSQRTPVDQTQDASANSVKASNKTCDIDYEKICRQFIDRPEIPYNGRKIATNRLAEELGRHPHIFIMPSDEKGESLGASIECSYAAAAQNKVIGAGLKPGDSLTEHAIRYAQSKGLCGKGADFQKEINDQGDRSLRE